MYEVETDALPANAMRIAGSLLARYVGASQGGRLGTQIALADPEEARQVARELHEYGYNAMVSKA